MKIAEFFVFKHLLFLYMNILILYYGKLFLMIVCIFIYNNFRVFT